MKIKLIFSCFFSLSFLLSYSQEQTPTTVREYNYQPNFLVGVDVLNAGVGVFADRKVLQGFISSNIRGNLHAVTDLGFESNIYQKNGYDVKAQGPFLRLGAFQMVMNDPENSFNGFYLGGKLAASFYRQHYMAVPVRGFGGSSASVAFSPTNQSSYWIEAVAGGRVQLFDSNFYIDVNVQPKYLVASTKQDNIKPMIVPGFGTSSGKFSFGFMWNIAYRF